jgi:hypothetical protein
MFGPWMRLWLDATMLALEAQTVIGLRLMMLGTGGAAAQAEAHRMIAEKASAFVEAATTRRAAERRTPSLPDIANTCEPTRGGFGIGRESNTVAGRHTVRAREAR